MHARVTSLAGSPANADAGIENFRANVVPYVRDKGRGAILLLDRESGDALAIRRWRQFGGRQCGEITRQ